MRKVSLIIIIGLISIIQCYGQTNNTDRLFTYQSFDTDVFKFAPIKREGVTDERFSYASRILNETKSESKGDPKNLNFADFWNITTAFVILKEPKNNIEIAFKKAVALDAKGVCGYIQVFGGAPNLEKAIPETFLPFYANCLQNSAQTEKINAKQYAIDNKLDVKLVTLMSTIESDDKKFRLTTPFDQAKQRTYDIKNEQLIDSLYAVYKTYIGKKLVGKDYESVMWLVIQHSDINTMEKYLTEISKAVEQKELPAGPLKMLIDRIYSIKYRYQIFGSQGGVPVSDENTASAVKKKYNIQ